mgnify:CR=1 FL=1
MGTVFQVPWTRIGSEARVWPHDGLAALHDAGFSCAAMALTDDSVSLGDPVLQEIDRLAIFMGTEGAGLGAKTIAAVTTRCAFRWRTGRFAQRGRGERRRLLAAVPAREQ